MARAKPTSSKRDAFTFAELARDIDVFARGLLALGIGPGDKVALWMPNRPEWVHAALAVMRIGAVLVPINTRLRTGDATYVLGQSDSTALILAARSGPVDYPAMACVLLPSLAAGGVGLRDARLPALRRVMVLGDAPAPGALAWLALLEAGARVPDDVSRKHRRGRPGWDGLHYLHLRNHGLPEGRDALSQHSRNAVDRAYRMAITPADTILMYLPLYHLYGFSEGILMSMVTGARQLVSQSFDATESLRLLERNGNRPLRLRHAF
jgi:fatty-acyl-CoA synthase